ncbi:MAG: arginine--tRNA ligase [Candidatus Omnitrophica bacterium]|nr:arginine--tRNA ligase [Candidatus Omnitrophota bacterium]
MQEFYSQLEEIIANSLKNSYPGEKADFFLEIPRNRKFGDLALSLPLKLSGLIEKTPLDIANALKTSIEEMLLETNPGVDKVEVVPPGFINFFLKDSAVRKLLGDLLKQEEDFFRSGKGSGQKIILEFVSANPTGPLSIAHGRQAVVGDVIGNLLAFLGSEVTREYYINDAGKQTDLLSDSVSALMCNKPVPQDGYQAEYVKQIASQALESKDYRVRSDAFDIKEFALKSCLDWIKKDLELLGVNFDTWISQQRDIIDKGKVEEAVEFLRKKGLVYGKEEALWFSSTKFGDDKDRVVRKADTELTYFASDIAYHKDKIERGFNAIINLWGPDHHGYISRVASAIEALGFKREFLEVIIIQLVSLKTKGRMSKRKGTAVLLSDLIDEVGKDAARFYYLTRKNSSHLEFDVDLAKAKTFDNPLYYIQYAHARICSIINKYNPESGSQRPADLESLSLLSEEEEISLIKQCLQFKNILELSFQQREPYFILDYLGGLSSSFHKFYEVHRVLVEGDKDLTRARVYLIKSVKIVLGLGLKLLGVCAPEEM